MLPARSDLLWGWGGGWGAGQAAHPHHSQAGPTPSCLLRLTWAIPGPGPTRLHWPLENPGVRPLQVDSRSQAPRHGCPRTGALGRALAASFPQPCPRPLQHWQSFKGRCWVHPPHCCPPEGTAHPHSELSPWIHLHRPRLSVPLKVLLWPPDPSAWRGGQQDRHPVPPRGPTCQV